MALHTVTLPAIIHSFPSSTPDYPIPLPFQNGPSSSHSESQSCWHEGRHNSVSAIRSPGLCLGGIREQSQVPSPSLCHHLPSPSPHQPREAPDPGRVVGGGGKVRGAALGPNSHFLAQSLSLCGKLLKVIKHPEVVKCAVNEVLINTPQEKIKRYHYPHPHPTPAGSERLSISVASLFGR